MDAKKVKSISTEGGNKKRRLNPEAERRMGGIISKSNHVLLKSREMEETKKRMQRLSLEENKKPHVGGIVSKIKANHVLLTPQAPESREMKAAKERMQRDLVTRMAMELLHKSQKKPEPERRAPAPKTGPTQADMVVKVSVSDKGGNEKKRLSLEEYKRRRGGFTVPKPRPDYVFLAPQVPDSPSTKARKYRELMTRMAMEVFETVPKAQMEPEQISPKLPDFVAPARKPAPLPMPEPIPARRHFPERNSFSSFQTRRKDLDPLATAPVKIIQHGEDKANQYLSKRTSEIAEQRSKESCDRKRKRSSSSSSGVSSTTSF